MALAAACCIAIVAFPFLQPYQQARVINFVAARSKRPKRRHLQRAAGADRHWFGWAVRQGYGHGTQTQLRFMKVRHTDFIFSATAEEFGMIGAILIVIIEAFVIWRCLRAAQKARDLSGAMIAFGVAMLLFFQSAANIAVNLRLIPVSGLPLPFISYGGSGLMALMIGVGLVESVVMRHKELEF